MATIDYSSVTSATIVNNGTEKATVQLYRVNLYKDIEAGDTLVLGIDTSEEAVYYSALGGYPAPTDTYVLLTEEPDNWATNYTDYYVLNGEDFEENSESTWATDTFYEKVVVYASKGQGFSVTIK